jgi:uncharacterized protein involved in type VI secretion and phage assembly
MSPVATRVAGVVIGLVKDVDDPEGVGRVRVTFPWLDPDAVSGWAPVAAPMGGNDRGYYYMPEVDDEALVAFEHGDLDHPFVIGFLHNGVDKPPTGGIDTKVRRVKSVAGHVVDLDDRSGSEKVHVRTNGGHVLDLRDNDTTIELTTSGGQRLTMTDRPASIELKTTAGTKVTMSDAPSQVAVRTVGGVQVTVSDLGVTVDAGLLPVTVNTTSAQVNADLNVDVTAAAEVSLTAATVLVDAPITTFTGVVLCQTLVATAVASSSYTPGVGNIL